MPKKKLASYLLDSYGVNSQAGNNIIQGGNNVILMGIQNTAQQSPGMCFGCRFGMIDFASQFSEFTVDVFEDL